MQPSRTCLQALLQYFTLVGTRSFMNRVVVFIVSVLTYRYLDTHHLEVQTQRSSVFQDSDLRILMNTSRRVAGSLTWGTFPNSHRLSPSCSVYHVSVSTAVPPRNFSLQMTCLGTRTKLARNPGLQSFTGQWTHPLDSRGYLLRSSLYSITGSRFLLRNQVRNSDPDSRRTQVRACTCHGSVDAPGPVGRTYREAGNPTSKIRRSFTPSVATSGSYRATSGKCVGGFRS